MKHLNKRSMIVFAMVGPVVVAALAVLAFNPVGGGGLTGATTLAIMPSNPTFVAGSAIGLSVNSVFGCKWSTSDGAVASLVNPGPKSVRVTGTEAGSATITAKCGMGALNVNSVSTTVTALPALAITPANPSVIVGNTKMLSVPTGYNCTWEISDGAVASFVGANSGSSVTVRGTRAGLATTVLAVCGTWGTTNTLLAVNNLVFSPDKITGVTGQRVYVNAPTGSGYPCTWTTSSADVEFFVNNQPTSTAQDSPYGVWLYFNTRLKTGGIASITLSCSPGQSAILKAKSCYLGDTACLNDTSF